MENFEAAERSVWPQNRRCSIKTANISATLLKPGLSKSDLVLLHWIAALAGKVILSRMLDLLFAHWGQFLAVLSIVMGAAAAIHAAMTKEDVRAAIGWVGVIILSPIVGALLYAVAGINRIRRASLISQRNSLFQ